jgi:tRNA-dihydrouridine synthase B
MARRFGAALAYTEMIKATPLARRDAKTLRLAARHEDENPAAIQICGARPAEMAEAARIAVEELGYQTVDINMGCPVRKVVREGAGAAMLKTPDLVGEVVSAVVEAVPVPVTVKIRSGWAGDSVCAVPVAIVAESAGAAAIAIHGRTREQRHGGDVDLESIAAVKRAVSIPVIGNGGIETPEAAVRMVDATGCDAVMIGRGAFGSPWLFRDVEWALRGGEPLPPPPLAEQRDMALWHHARTMDIFGAELGSRVFRKFAAWYFRNTPFGNQYRAKIYRATEPWQVETLLVEWFEHRQALLNDALQRDDVCEVALLMGATWECHTRGAVGPLSVELRSVLA